MLCMYFMGSPYTKNVKIDKKKRKIILLFWNVAFLSFSVVDTIPILTDAEIDALGSVAEGVAKIKKAMQLRGDMRRIEVGLQKKVCLV